MTRAAKGVPARRAELAGGRKRELCDLFGAEPVNAAIALFDATDVAVTIVIGVRVRVSRRPPAGADAENGPAFPDRQQAGVPASQDGIEPPWPASAETAIPAGRKRIDQGGVEDVGPVGVRARPIQSQIEA